jgi:hypothetical protein
VLVQSTESVQEVAGKPIRLSGQVFCALLKEPYIDTFSKAKAPGYSLQESPDTPELEQPAVPATSQKFPDFEHTPGKSAMVYTEFTEVLVELILFSKVSCMQ